MAGADLIQLEWWDLPAWILAAFLPLTIASIVLCIFVTLRSRNPRLPRALVYAWAAIGVGFLGASALYSDIPALRKIYDQIFAELFVVWGFCVLGYVVTTITIGIAIRRPSGKTTPYAL